MRTVWAAGTVSLKPGLLRLFEWEKDFNMHTQRQTHTQVWVRLWKLPQEYWMERTLYEIAGAVGTSLLIDNVTRNRLYGHYARILVDMDLSKDIFYEIMVEREGFAFPLAIEYEGLPFFASIAHDVSKCCWLYPRKDDFNHKDTDGKGKGKVPIKKPAWMPLKDNPSGTGSSKAFEASHTVQPLLSKNISENSFSFALQNVTDEVPQRVLPTEVPLLTLVTNDSQDADIPPEGNNSIPVVDVIKSSIAAGSHLHLEHVEVQEEPIDDLVDTTAATDTQATQAASEGTTTDVDNVDREVSPTVQLVDTEGAELEHINRPVIVREEGMTHINPRIQHDLDIWQKIKDYDKRAAENPFKPVLSKKKANVKETSV